MIDEKKLIEEIRNAINDDRYDGYKPSAVLFEVFDMILEAPKVDKWIPCSERLPNSTFNVEVTTKDNKRTIGYYAGYAGNWYSPITDDLIFVKAWKEPSDPWEGEYK